MLYEKKIYYKRLFVDIFFLISEIRFLNRQIFLDAKKEYKKFNYEFPLLFQRHNAAYARISAPQQQQHNNSRKPTLRNVRRGRGGGHNIVDITDQKILFYLLYFQFNPLRKGKATHRIQEDTDFNTILVVGWIRSQDFFWRINLDRIRKS